MNLTIHPYKNEADYWEIRNFLREIFLLNDRLENFWHVARLDYWRWHLVLNCQFCEPIEKVITTWKNEDGKIAAVLNPIAIGEICMHIHPHYRSPQTQDAVLAYAEQQPNLYYENERGERSLYIPVDAEDTQLQKVLLQRGYEKVVNIGHKWHRDLDAPLPEVPLAPGYTIRSMGPVEEHPARSWASWTSFHSDEAVENYDGDYSWFANLQTSPLYRRDLDIVAVAPQGEIAAFCTIYYDDYTRSAVCVLVGTAAEHWRRGLGKAVLAEGFRRLKRLGCTRVFATAHDDPAHALYGSMMQTMQLSETWLKRL